MSEQPNISELDPAALLAELDAARAVVAAARRWLAHPTSALPIEQADMLIIGELIESIAAYDAALHARKQ